MKITGEAVFRGHSIFTEGVFLTQLSTKCRNRILRNCVGCVNWLLRGRCEELCQVQLAIALRTSPRRCSISVFRRVRIIAKSDY